MIVIPIRPGQLWMFDSPDAYYGAASALDVARRSYVSFKRNELFMVMGRRTSEQFHAMQGFWIVLAPKGLCIIADHWINENCVMMSDVK